MRIPSQASYFITGAATLALLAGCSGGNGITSPVSGGSVAPQQTAAKTLSTKHKIQMTHSVLRPGVKLVHGGAPIHPFLNTAAIKNTVSTIAISDAADNVVDLFDGSGNQVGQLSGFAEPQGMASDIKGNLYVADTENSRIQVYKAGYQGTPTSLSDPGQYPAGVDSFSNGKYVGVTNIISTSGGSGSVSFFKGTTLLRTLSSSSLLEAFFGAFDSTGNFYFDGFDSNGETAVFEVVGGFNGTAITELTVSNGLNFPGGVQVTTTGQIAIDDQSGFAVYTYNPPSDGSLGAPTVTTPLNGVSDPVTYAFTNDMTTLYTADAGLAASQSYAYPAGGSPESSFNVSGQPIGIAVVPTQFPKTGQ